MRYLYTLRRSLYKNTTPSRRKIRAEMTRLQLMNEIERVESVVEFKNRVVVDALSVESVGISIGAL